MQEETPTFARSCCLSRQQHLKKERKKKRLLMHWSRTATPSFRHSTFLSSHHSPWSQTMCLEDTRQNCPLGQTCNFPCIYKKACRRLHTVFHLPLQPPGGRGSAHLSALLRTFSRVLACSWLRLPQRRGYLLQRSLGSSGKNSTCTEEFRNSSIQKSHHTSLVLQNCPKKKSYCSQTNPVCFELTPGFQL